MAAGQPPRTLTSLRRLSQSRHTATLRHTGEHMNIRILGPVTISPGERLSVPTAPKPRQVLALMLVNANRIVPVSDFIRELWDEDPPASAITTLQTYIMQLRNRLSRALAVDRARITRDVIVTAPVGYMFRVPQADLDLCVYRERSITGQRLLMRGDYEDSARVLAAALDLWHGPPLVDVRAGHLLQIEIRRLEESRLHTRERLIDARLRLGHHGELLDELTWLTAQHPMNECLHATLMLALYRAGRRPEALAAFRHLRGVLVSELGIEPCPQVQVLQRAILSSDPQLEQLWWHPFTTHASLTAARS